MEKNLSEMSDEELKKEMRIYEDELHERKKKQAKTIGIFEFDNTKSKFLHNIETTIATLYMHKTKPKLKKIEELIGQITLSHLLDKENLDKLYTYFKDEQC